MDEHEKYEACRQAMAADETEARAAAERTEREKKAAVALVAALEEEDEDVIQHILKNGGVDRERYEVARRAMEADEAAARAAAEKAEREKAAAAAAAVAADEEDGVWEALKDIERRVSGKNTLIEAAISGLIAAKTISEFGEPSPSVEQLEERRKHEAEAQRRREEYQKFLESLPPGERILHEKIDALESRLADRDSRMDEMEDKYKRRISDLERDISELEE